jgi:hypothetical protein
LGVTLVQKSLDADRGGAFDVEAVAAGFRQWLNAAIAYMRRCFPFNFSVFLIEDLVIVKTLVFSTHGLQSLLDWRNAVVDQLHFKDAGHYLGRLCGRFQLLPQPAWDPTTCWRTHRALNAARINQWLMQESLCVCQPS